MDSLQYAIENRVNASINVEEISSIINQTFDLSNVTILYVNAPSATEKEIFITSEIYYENVDSIFRNLIYMREKPFWETVILALI